LTQAGVVLQLSMCSTHSHAVISMSTIHARLDEETEALCARLRKAQGWSDSEIVRRGIKALAAYATNGGERKFIGEGKYRSGLGDLSTNPKYMEGFGE
jgi:hypothetical protein